MGKQLKPGSLEKMVAEAGYAGISDFVKRSGVAVSFETARRAISEDKHSTWTLFLVLRALGISKDKIKSILKQEGDTLLAPVIGESSFSDGQLLIAQTVEKIFEADEQAKSAILSVIAISAKAAGVNVVKEVDRLKVLYGVS